MSDLISRQAAISHVGDVPYIKEHPNVGLLWKAWIESLPSAQPVAKDINVPINDCISRQAAIDAIADMHCKSDEDGYVWIIRSDAWARIDALPSAQPEDCDTCKHGYFGDNHCDNCRVRYPSHYERRTDEGDK